MAERDYYSLEEAYFEDGRLWMHLDQLDAPWRVFELLLDGDYPAVGCGW